MLADLLPVPTGPLTIPETADAPVYLSLVIPTYREAQNIEALLVRLTRLLEATLSGTFELIVVDDDSPDFTWKLAQGLTADYPHLRVMRRTDERGLATAVVRGWQASRGQLLGVIDGDLQHPPENVLKLLAAAEQGTDLAVASRHTEGGGVSTWSLTRRLVSRGAQLVGLVVLPSVVGRVSDPMSGFFVVRRACLAGKLLSPLGYKILLEVLGRGDIHTIREVGYVFEERTQGESKVTLRQYGEYLLHLLRLRLAR
ncbi:polyprenol monophosphomannose synthase [Gloeobacter morelensis]|uniref:Polyprenol monophosphomannose synthase n=1 Tax=Gloeobacter morelensis MG652769 TaxID=2781736 RepID=A0ABY3PGA3_9CYAN|nr:polyprenol monophosphomannose synthase [Gloeobacter morelensis]UFP92686.1 polyprenol monophosphomannose synthase [Gloeobacter morelensis MG652769]